MNLATLERMADIGGDNFNAKNTPDRMRYRRGQILRKRGPWNRADKWVVSLGGVIYNHDPFIIGPCIVNKILFWYKSVLITIYLPLRMKQLNRDSIYGFIDYDQFNGMDELDELMKTYFSEEEIIPPPFTEYYIRPDGAEIEILNYHVNTSLMDIKVELAPRTHPRQKILHKTQLYEMVSAIIGNLQCAEIPAGIFKNAAADAADD